MQWAGFATVVTALLTTLALCCPPDMVVTVMMSPRSNGSRIGCSVSSWISFFPCGGEVDDEHAMLKPAGQAGACVFYPATFPIKRLGNIMDVNTLASLSLDMLVCDGDEMNHMTRP